jgi:hypothetical protein
MPGKAGYEIGMQMGDDRGSAAILKYLHGPPSEDRTGYISSVTASEKFAMCIPPGGLGSSPTVQVYWHAQTALVAAR